MVADERRSRGGRWLLSTSWERGSCCTGQTGRIFGMAKCRRETTRLKGLALLALCFACLGVSSGKRAVVLRRARERKRAEVQRSDGKRAVMVTGRGSGFQTWPIFQQLIR
jgi:hypothetical protein